MNCINDRRQSIMIDREKVIKEYEDFVNRYISVSVNDDYVLEMHKAVLALLKEQETELCDRCGRIRLKSSREVK
jgi:hypothetical protein